MAKQRVRICSSRNKECRMAKCRAAHAHVCTGEESHGCPLYTDHQDCVHTNQKLPEDMLMCEDCKKKKPDVTIVEDLRDSEKECKLCDLCYSGRIGKMFDESDEE